MDNKLRKQMFTLQIPGQNQATGFVVYLFLHYHFVGTW